MILTKHAHACVVVTTATTTLLVDPGTFTPDAAKLLAVADGVLLTHDHFDHFDEEAVADALRQRPSLPVFGPRAVADKLPFASVKTIRNRDVFTIGDIPVRAFGTAHALIHDDIPQVENVGYLIGEAVFHPGDAYAVPDAPVDTLLLPTSGPWTKLADAVDYVRALAPRRVIQIHELMASELGQRSTANFVGSGGLTDTPFLILQPGESTAAVP